MRNLWDDEQFDIDIPPDEPIFALNVVCGLLDMQYWTLHQIIEEGLIELAERKKNKKLFSFQDVRRLKYIQYLMDEKGVNIQGVRVILEIEEK